MITENLSTLKIHKLTKAQYERELAAGNIDENALYLTPDDSSSSSVDLTGYATEDFVTNAISANGKGITSVETYTDIGSVSTSGSTDPAYQITTFNYSDGTSTTLKIDTTLTEQWAAADAKTVGEALATKQPAGDYLTEETDPTVPAWAKQSTKPTYIAGEVGADAVGTASSLVTSHNVATDAHADIRESINQLSLDKADKTGLTLGVHTDGLVYIFVDGVPQGNGLAIKADVL